MFQAMSRVDGKRNPPSGRFSVIYLRAPGASAAASNVVRHACLLDAQLLESLNPPLKFLAVWAPQEAPVNFFFCSCRITGG